MEREDEHIVKKRNRPSLVCGACKKRKIKCDKGKPCISCVKNKIEHLCIYDEKWVNGKKKTKRRKQQPASAPAVGPTISESPTEPTSSNSFSSSASIKNVNKENSVVVIVPKSELDELRAKVQKYELGLISPARSDNSEELNPSSSNNTSNAAKNPSVYPPPEQEAHFYNRSMNPTRRSMGSFHDASRPGDIPVENILLSNQCFITKDMPPPKAKRITMEDVPKHDFYVVGINPYESPSDTINFYENSNSIRVKERTRKVNYGPLAWASISRRNKYLTLVKKFTSSQKAKEIVERINKSKASTAEPPSTSSCSLLKPLADDVKSTLNMDGSQIRRFEQKSKESDGEYDESLSYVKESTGERESTNPHPIFQEMNQRTMLLGLSILDGPIDREKKLIEQIESMVPKKRVIWLLVERFFRVVYPFVPFIDEEDFRYNIERLIGQESYEEVKPSVNIEKRLDFAYVGVLCVVLRLSYLSLFFNRSSINEAILKKPSAYPDDQVRKYLLLNGIHICAIDMAQICLHQFQLLRKVSLPILQCALYLRLYHTLAPEDGDGLDGGDSQIFKGMLVQMCYSLGLNREPDNYKDSLTDEKTNHLGRKIWYHLVISDFIQAFTFGNPLTTNSMYYDTVPPFINVDNSNLKDTELEGAVTNCFKFGQALIRGPMKGILDMTLNVGKQVKIPELTQLVNHLELGVTGIFGRVRDYVKLLESEDVSYHFNKIKKAQILLSLNAFFVSMYYHFYDYYENKGNSTLSYFYLKKLLAVTITELTPYFFPLIIRSSEIFGEGADLVINPDIIQATQRTSEVIMIIVIKINFWLYRRAKSSDHQFRMNSDHKYKNYFETMSTLVVCMEKCAKICLMAASIMSSRYYYAWGVSKSHTFLHKVVADEELYSSNDDFELNFIAPTNDQLQDLTNLVQNTLTVLNRTVGEHCDSVDLRALFKVHGQKPSVLKNLKTEEQTVQRAPLDALNNYSLQDVPTLSSTNTPMSDSSNIPLELSGFEDLRFDGSDQIDSLWLQMLSSKNNKQNTLNDNLNYNEAIPSASSYNTDVNAGYYNNTQYTSSTSATTSAPDTAPEFNFPFTANYQLFENLGNALDGEDGHLDFFNDLPLDKVFN
ncbi:fungal transcriptional regulatory protein [Scheffersomyces xylosifermentans]|uniref:fungal transcriptional regulatory protein n=1 Tax=Scheffersomyces xylosifermentans TaxID=1304137 RepID=UPI00315C83A7